MADREFIEATAHVLGVRLFIDDDTLYVSRKATGTKLFRLPYAKGGFTQLSDDQFVAWIKRVLENETGPAL